MFDEGEGGGAGAACGCDDSTVGSGSTVVVRDWGEDWRYAWVKIREGGGRGGVRRGIAWVERGGGGGISRDRDRGEGQGRKEDTFGVIDELSEY